MSCCFQRLLALAQESLVPQPNASGTRESPGGSPAPPEGHGECQIACRKASMWAGSEGVLKGVAWLLRGFLLETRPMRSRKWLELFCRLSVTVPLERPVWGSGESWRPCPMGREGVADASVKGCAAFGPSDSDSRGLLLIPYHLKGSGCRRQADACWRVWVWSFQPHQ